jgi:aspartyl-tRNA(Asn)/glutamyl-tRNA(Gln) amidotransferase subunit A
MTDALSFLSAAELRARLVKRALSPVEVTRAVLDRIDSLQPKLNCFITICGEAALAAARASEAAMLRGEAQGLLAGIPYTAKDLVDTQGVRTTYGSLLFRDHVPEADAVAIARLRRAGAILVGKTTTPEFGTKGLTDAPLFGRTRNAWSAAHSAGGSSGGAAVAVASGLAPLAVATDGGGSTRIPASSNGVVGLKQSNGVVPHSQAPDAFGNYTYVTPMTRTVLDTALMLQAMAGPDASDPWSIGLDVPNYLAAARAEGDLRGARILYCLAPPGRPVAAAVKAAFEASLARLADLGAVLEEMPGEGFDIEPIWRVINHTTWRARFGAMVARSGNRMSPSLVRQVESASAVTGVQYQEAMIARAQLFRRVEALFSRADFLATPTLLRPALPIDQDLFDPIDIDGVKVPDLRASWFPWTMPWNLTGHPAISLNCDFSPEGLPIGLQLIGRFRAEPALLRAAALFEAATGLTERWPAEL